jgi:hypothetical protein
MSGTYLFSFTVQSYTKQFNILMNRTQSLGVYPIYQVRVITFFTVFRLLTDFVCLYIYDF